MKINGLLSRFFTCFRVVIASLIMLLLIRPGKAQHVSTQLYTVNDGLPVSNIFHIYQDHFDYLWIGTFNGVSRFDGRDFINYSLTDGLPSLFVDRIFEDDAYRLWVGTRAGMARLSGGRFITYPVSDSKQIKFTFDIIQTRKKEIWALTNEGVYQFNDSIWQNINLLPGAGSTRQVIETDSGIYVNYGNCIAFRNNEKKWRIIDKHPTDVVYFNRMRLHRGNIYVNTKQEILQLKNDKFITIFQDRSGNGHFTYFFDSDNRLWHYRMYFDNAIYVSEPGHFEKTKALVTNTYGLVVGTSEDRFGNFWNATSSGLLKISIAPFTSELKTRKPASPFINTIPLIDSSVLFMNEDSTYIGRYIQGTDSMMMSFLTVSTLGIIDCFGSDENGKVWMFNRNRECHTYYNGKFEKVNFNTKLTTKELFDNMAFDKQKGRFFISGDTTIYTLREGDFKPFIPSNRKGKMIGLFNTLITRNNKVLIYIHGEGIYRVNEKV